MLASTVWTADQVEAVAPDPMSLSAARRLARSGRWIGVGASDEPLSLWGLCQGSGKTPYQTCLDLAEPAYRCSCPSRKFPCKHALALMLRWADGLVEAGEPPGWVSDWHEGRRAQAAKRQQKAAAPRTEAQERAAQKRAESRLDRVTLGAAELHQWLTDQVRHGIAGLDQAGYQVFEQVAARLVDAQAPGLAATMRRLAAVPYSGPGWQERLLAEFSLVHLLTGAAAKLDTLPPDLAATVQSRLGQAIPAERVLATAPVRDTWQVVGVRDFIEEDRLSTRRAWLVGRETGREALVLSFAMPGQVLAADLVAGTAVDADLCFYPGTVALRAMVSVRHGPPSLCADPAPALSVDAAMGRLAGALAREPWLGSWPMLVRGLLVPGEKWHLTDETGAAFPLDPGVGDCWRLIGATGGAPATIAVEWAPGGVTPMAAFVDGSVVPA